MAGTAPLCSNMVSQSINFHGHQLLKQLTTSHPKDLETLNLKDIDYNVYKARVHEVCKQGNASRQELLHFITTKCPNLFLPREVNPWAEVSEDDFGMEDRRNQLPPLEYFMKVESHIREDMFFKTVKRGDILFAKVSNYLHELLQCVKIHSTMGDVVRDLIDTDIKAHLRVEDSNPDPPDQDPLGRWMLRTRLCVEVLEVDASDHYLLVGTNGVTIQPHLKDKIKLGKITVNDQPPIISKMKEHSIKSYSQALEKLSIFNNPRSIRHLAGKFGLDIFAHSSLMDTLKYKFADREMYKSLRKAQMSRWAHKSVADGVVFFKRGQHEEAFQCLNKALQIDNENVEAFVAKGALLANLGRFEKAVEDFEQALEHNPTHSNARKYICETLVELGRQLEEDEKMEEAEKKYKKCLEINPEHPAGLEAMNSLNRKLGRVNDQYPGETDYVQRVLRDLIEMEEEFKRKSQPTTSDSKSSPNSKLEERSSRSRSRGRTKSSSHTQSRSRSRSMSPLAKKMSLQEGRWHPPSNIDTTSSYMESVVPHPNMGVAPVVPGYGYPVPGWPPSTVAHMVPNAQLLPPALYSHPPPGYSAIPAPGMVSSSNYASHEDEEYKARVDKFLKQLEGSRPSDKKDRGKKCSTRERESRRRRKRSRDSRKRRSRSNKSRSRSISYSSTSRSTSSSSSNSSSSSSDSSDDSNRKKYKKRKKNKKNDKKDKKVGKMDKVHKDQHEEQPCYPPSLSKVEEDPIPELESLNKKLSAYYKKVEASQREAPSQDKNTKAKDTPKKEGDKNTKAKDTPNKEGGSDKPDSIALMMNVMKSYEQGFRLSKTKLGANSAPTVKAIHPAFRESDEDDILDQPASSCINQEKSPVSTNKAFIENSIIKPKSHSKVLSRSHSRSPSRSHPRSQYRRDSCERSRSKGRSIRDSRERSRSKGRSIRDSRERSRSKGRNIRDSRERSRSKGRNIRDSRERSMSRTLSHTRPRSWEHEFPHSSGRSLHKSFTTAAHYPRHFQGQGQHSWERGAHFKQDLHEREMMIEAARQKIENQIKYGDDDSDVFERKRHSKTPSHRESTRYGSPGRRKSSRPKTPSRWDSSRPKTPSRWDSSRPKTPSRWESSRPKTPSRWESSRPKTPSRWESSRPKTPSRWESSRPKTPSRWDSSRPKTPSRWDSSRPKTPSRWDSSRPKTPSRWDSSRPKTPSRWESSRPKTPSRWDSSRPKTPSRWDSSRPVASNNDDDRSSAGKVSPNRSDRFGKWDKEENNKQGEPKIGNSLTEMETFVEAAKQKQLELMKERNKEFLKPPVD
ncbi:tetratricopeptide repeat protein 14-like isoform X2 [Homarus americanus]|uniref:tetratricopeptide repeat protein 14-like isoform X2 n=1 Tax=Homarus americanus TaxID=6706 RepID=UPI001C47DD5C|nr:tetratricopeptide repeat protein 14-like isoform X2 [Homarus americanus]